LQVSKILVKKKFTDSIDGIGSVIPPPAPWNIANYSTGSEGEVRRGWGQIEKEFNTCCKEAKEEYDRSRTQALVLFKK
jgi:hypothetical protein